MEESRNLDPGALLLRPHVMQWFSFRHVRSYHFCMEQHHWEVTPQELLKEGAEEGEKRRTNTWEVTTPYNRRCGLQGEIACVWGGGGEVAHPVELRR